MFEERTVVASDWKEEREERSSASVFRWRTNLGGVGGRRQQQQEAEEKILLVSYVLLKTGRGARGAGSGVGIGGTTGKEHLSVGLHAP